MDGRGRTRGGPRPLVRLAARGLAGTRVAIGTALLAAPAASTRRWFGERGEDDPGRQIAVRGLGARDVVLGIGALTALRSGRSPRRAARWIEAGIVADLADAAATAVADDLEVPRAPMTTVALGGAALGALVRAGLR